MFSRLTISRKILLVLLPLFLLAVGTSVYVSYRYQEQHALDQMQSAAKAQASIIKESLVQMMVTTQRVDQQYIDRINKTGDVENVSIWFYADSLHLDEDLLSPSRLQRLRNSELKLPPDQQLDAERVFSNGESLWLVQCELGRHTEGLVEVLSSGRPLWFHSCERLKVILPFTADGRCQRCHNVDEGTVLGAAYMEMPLDKTVRALASNAERTIWIFGIFTLVAIGIGAFLFHAFVSRPVNRLIQATHIVGEGNLDHTIAPEFASDEFGELAHSFDAMQLRLKESQEKLLHEERLSAVGKMASTIVHDLRSPLSAVLLGLNMVKKNGSGREGELLDVVRSSILRINRMAQELLDFSRGEIRLNRRQIDPGVFLKSLKEEIKPFLEQAEVRLITTLDYNGHAVIDPDRLHRALLNLINNAADVLPRRGEINLTITRLEDDLVFIVADNGPGIPEKIRDKVFDPFVTAGKAKGTGLGLSITKEIVELHGGSISFVSTAGEGTTFTVKIPLQDQRSTTGIHKELPKQTTTHALEREK